ncbi:MAG: DNA mismatch repair protein MutS [Panacibacter sp.]
MNVDNTTLNDLSIFAHEEELSVFHRLDFARTVGGRYWLKYYVDEPLGSIKLINDRQQLLQRIIGILDKWPVSLNNGTIMMIEKYFESSVDTIPKSPDIISALSYKIFSGPDYSLIDYTVGHFIVFIKGMYTIVELLLSENNAPELSTILERISTLMKRPVLQNIVWHDVSKKLKKSDVLKIGHFLKYEFKSQCQDLIELYGRLDAFYSLATSCEKYQFCFPEFAEVDRPQLSAKQLYHPLLPVPVSYDIELTEQQNFLFLTGANMAGKSTFIKAIGVSVYLAHLGMGVPAKNMQLSYFDGLLSNIQVVDNIIKGESYFYNEVQRIHKTLERISDGKKWLILIDELFKGTNVQDAMKCSTVVIEGLRKMKNTAFILSTHLYEIGEGLKQYPNIQFRYFETEVNDGQLLFSYQLKNGISNDRLGYLILKKEGVVDMLEKL